MNCWKGPVIQVARGCQRWKAVGSRTTVARCNCRTSAKAVVFVTDRSLSCVRIVNFLSFLIDLKEGEADMDKFCTRFKGGEA